MKYCFFIASLPDLQLDTVPAMTPEEFDSLCAEELPEKQLKELTAFSGTVDAGCEDFSGLPPVYAAYAKFELYLRNRVAKRRADKAGVTLELPDPPEYFGEFDHIAGTLANAEPGERERMLDKLRWDFLDEQTLCQEFGFAAICVYRLKLMIVNKYRHRKLEPGQLNFDAALERLSPNQTRQE